MATSKRFIKVFGIKAFREYRNAHPKVDGRTTMESIVVTHQHDFVHYTTSLEKGPDTAFGEWFVAEQITVPIERWEFRNGRMSVLLAFVEADNKVLWVNRKPKRLEL